MHREELAGDGIRNGTTSLRTSASVLSRAIRPGQPLMAPSSGAGTLLVKKMCAVPYVALLPAQSCAIVMTTSLQGSECCPRGFSVIAAPPACIPSDQEDSTVCRQRRMSRGNNTRSIPVVRDRFRVRVTACVSVRDPVRIRVRWGWFRDKLALHQRPYLDDSPDAGLRRCEEVDASRVQLRLADLEQIVNHCCTPGRKRSVASSVFPTPWMLI